jgi:DNA invertase Pin-like site-specific DNA recombinase
LPDSALVVARKKSKPKKSDPPKMGRPTVLNNEEVFKLAKYGHSVQEIADIFGAHRDTIYKNYFDKYTEGRAAFKKSVRLAQFKRGVLEGSDKMLIHIGKSNLDEQKPAHA